MIVILCPVEQRIVVGPWRISRQGSPTCHSRSGRAFELARHKLHEQVANEVPDEITRLNRALETAIQGVETHFNRLELLPLEARDGYPRLSSPEYQTIAAPKNAAVVGSLSLDADLDA